MWRISEEVSWTVKSSYFEKGAVQWIVCIEEKKCLSYICQCSFTSLWCIKLDWQFNSCRAVHCWRGAARLGQDPSLWALPGQFLQRPGQATSTHFSNTILKFLGSCSWQVTGRRLAAGWGDTVAAAADLLAASQALHLGAFRQWSNAGTRAVGPFCQAVYKSLYKCSN